MTRLHELSYQEITPRLRKLDFRFYRQGKGSTSYGCVTLMVG